MDGQEIVRNLDLAMMEATIRRRDAKTTPKEEGQEIGLLDQDEKSKKGEEE